jgi:TolA-binding protein
LARHALARRDGARAEALRAEADRRARWHEVFRARSNAKRAHPEAPEPRLALAEPWRAVGQLDRARAELDALLVLHPDHSEARARRATLRD